MKTTTIFSRSRASRNVNGFVTVLYRFVGLTCATIWLRNVPVVLTMFNQTEQIVSLHSLCDYGNFSKPQSNPKSKIATVLPYCGTDRTDKRNISFSSKSSSWTKKTYQRKTKTNPIAYDWTGYKFVFSETLFKRLFSAQALTRRAALSLYTQRNCFIFLKFVQYILKKL